MADTTSAPDIFTTAWEQWRTHRLAGLRAPDGPATLVATHWLDESDVVPGVPGRWHQHDGDVVLSLPPGESVSAGSETHVGDVLAASAAAEVGPRIHFASLTVQVTTRLGRRGVRVFDHAKADALGGVDAFDPSPDWTVRARYTPLPDASSLAYGFALESTPREVPVPGVVSFTLASRRYETEPFLDEGKLLLVFADRTTGTQTKPPSRFLLIDPPADIHRPADLIADFNRAFLPPCAFSDEFNCPLPPEAHRFDAAVTAGEQWVRWTPAQPSYETPAM